MANLVEFVSFFEELEHEQNECGDEVDGEWHHFKHAFPIISPCPKECHAGEQEYDRVEHEHEPLPELVPMVPDDIVVVLEVPEEYFHCLINNKSILIAVGILLLLTNHLYAFH